MVTLLLHDSTGRATVLPLGCKTQVYANTLKWRLISMMENGCIFDVGTAAT